jgi:hypothetical protein
MNKIYYPVVIPTLCRFTHFKRCIESLVQCTYADKTEVIIGLDYPLKEEHKQGYKQICEYLPTISGFKKVTIIRRTENWGALRNWQSLREYTFQHNDALIYSEDDNEFSPCFLDFMNKALVKYKDDNHIMSISGYNPVLYYGVQNSNVYCTPVSYAWGMGIWKDKENEFKSSLEYISKGNCILKSYFYSYKLFKAVPTSFNLLISMAKKGMEWEDVIRTSFNVLYGRVQLRPSISIVRNWGHDGSGEHCGVDKGMTEQKILIQSTFELDAISEYISIGKKIKLLFVDDLGYHRKRIFLRRIIILYRYLFYKFA